MLSSLVTSAEQTLRTVVASRRRLLVLILLCLAISGGFVAAQEGPLIAARISNTLTQTGMTTTVMANALVLNSFSLAGDTDGGPTVP